MGRTGGLIVAIAAIAAGCSNSSSHNATPSTVTQTVTKTVAAKSLRHAPGAPSSPTYTTFGGSYFSVDYPDTWNVEAAEADKGGYLDTTIRSIADPNLMIRVDVTPGASANAASSASVIEQSLSAQPGYRQISFASTPFEGHSAVDWEFVVREKGVLLHKQDTFFDDDYGEGLAILTQAPAAAYGAWGNVFAHVRASLALPQSGETQLPPAAEPPPSPSPPADFCSTHACSNNFDSGNGYIVQCNDGMWSQSGGLSGACSYHGGESGNGYP